MLVVIVRTYTCAWASLALETVWNGQCQTHTTTYTVYCSTVLMHKTHKNTYAVKHSQRGFVFRRRKGEVVKCCTVSLLSPP